MSTWYFVAADQQRHGPVSDAQLAAAYRSGQVALDSLVWQTGMTDWQPLRQFAAQLQLTGAGSAVPPPMPTAAIQSGTAATGWQKKSQKTLAVLCTLSVMPPLAVLGLPHLYMRAWGLWLINIIFSATGIFVLVAAKYLEGGAYELQKAIDFFKKNAELIRTTLSPYPSIPYLSSYRQSGMENSSMVGIAFGVILLASVFLATLIHAIRMYRMSPAQFQTRLQTFKPGPLAWF